MAIRRARARRLLVTGGAGFLGRHVVTGDATGSWEVVAPPSSALDVRHRDEVLAAFRDWRPTAVIHTAARQGDRPSIVDGSANVAEAAAAVGARLVHVSTDALFAGRTEPYTESDPPSPVHDYGRDKADAERAVATADPSAVIVRTSLIYGASELSNHESIVLDAVDGRVSITFFSDEIRCPVLVEDLAAVLVDLVELREIAGPLHLAGAEPISRADLARHTARRHGWNASKLRFGRIEHSGLVRPGRVVLDSTLARTFGLGVRSPLDRLDP